MHAHLCDGLQMRVAELLVLLDDSAWLRGNCGLYAPGKTCSLRPSAEFVLSSHHPWRTPHSAFAADDDRVASWISI